MRSRYPGSDSDLEAAALLGPPLREALDVAEATDHVLRLLLATFERHTEDEPWCRAQGILVTRLVGDIRAAANLVLRGYFPQAMTLGASVYELSYTAAYIGNDSTRALTWLSWKEPDQTPWRRTHMVRVVRQQVFEEESSAEDARYMGLCWGKHGNPWFQKAAGIASTPEAHLLNIDPALGNKAHRLGELAIWSMLESTVTYVASLDKKDTLEADARLAATALVQAWLSFDARVWPRSE